jgi:hypothetical protein
LGIPNPPPQSLEFKHLSGNDGPELKHFRKAMIEQTHFSSKLTHTRKKVPDTKFIPLRNCLSGSGLKVLMGPLQKCID